MGDKVIALVARRANDEAPSVYDHPRRVPLPQLYQKARNALAECQSIDECKDWSDKAAALASYAKQAEDGELERMAVRIRSRAIRRMGELLKQFDGRNGQNLPDAKSTATDTFSLSQKQIAQQAGLSKRQKDTAVRVASIPQTDFDAEVESENPPTISTLAKLGIQSRPVKQGADEPTFEAAQDLADIEITPAEMDRLVDPLVGVITGSFFTDFGMPGHPDFPAMVQSVARGGHRRALNVRAALEHAIAFLTAIRMEMDRHE
jgi:hypothetical protein